MSSKGMAVTAEEKRKQLEEEKKNMELKMELERKKKEEDEKRKREEERRKQEIPQKEEERKTKSEPAPKRHIIKDEDEDMSEKVTRVIDNTEFYSSKEATCPICSKRFSVQQIEAHVNSCLDSGPSAENSNNNTEPIPPMRMCQSALVFLI
jgi:hypothetical protein